MKFKKNTRIVLIYCLHESLFLQAMRLPVPSNQVKAPKASVVPTPKHLNSSSQGSVKASRPSLSRTSSNSSKSSSASFIMLESDPFPFSIDPNYEPFSDTASLQSKKSSSSHPAALPHPSLARAASNSSTSSLVMLEVDPFPFSIDPNYETFSDTASLQSKKSSSSHPPALPHPSLARAASNSSTSSLVMLEVDSFPFSIDPNYEPLHIDNSPLHKASSSSYVKSMQNSLSNLFRPSTSPRLTAANLEKHQLQFKKVDTDRLQTPLPLQRAEPTMPSFWKQAASKAQQSLDFMTGTTRGEDKIGKYVTQKNLNGTTTTTYQPMLDGKTRRIVTSADGTKKTEIVSGENYQQITNFNAEDKPTSVKLKTPEFSEHGMYENNTYLFKLKQGPEKILSIGKEVRVHGEPKITPITSPQDPIYQRMVKFRTKQEVTSFIDGILQSMDLLPTKELLKAKAQLIAHWRPNLSWQGFAALWAPLVQTSTEQAVSAATQDISL